MSDAAAKPAKRAHRRRGAPGTPGALAAAPLEIKRCKLGSGSPDAPHALGHASRLVQPVNVRSPLSRSHRLPPRPGLKRRAASCHSDARWPSPRTGWLMSRAESCAAGTSPSARSPRRGSAERGSEPTLGSGHTVWSRIAALPRVTPRALSCAAAATCPTASWECAGLGINNRPRGPWRGLLSRERRQIRVEVAATEGFARLGSGQDRCVRWGSPPPCLCNHQCQTEAQRLTYCEGEHGGVR